jgi:hypothetical protein
MDEKVKNKEISIAIYSLLANVGRALPADFYITVGNAHPT